MSAAEKYLTNYRTNGVRIGFIDNSKHSECQTTIAGLSMVPITAQEMFDACPLPGFYIDLTVKVYDFLHIPRDKIYLLPMPDRNFGSLVNGTWHGLLGNVSRNEIDSTLAHLIPTSERLKIADFSASLFSSEGIFLTR